MTAPTDGSQLDLDEADRLAESIRPAWETEDSHDKPADLAAEKPAGAGPTRPSSAEPPRDTVIDGAPLMAVGKTDPGRTDPAEPLRSSQLEPALRPIAPRPAKATVIGIGSDDVMPLKNGLAEKSANGPAAAGEKKSSPPAAPEGAKTKESERGPAPEAAGEKGQEKQAVTIALPVKDLKAEARGDAKPSDEAPASKGPPRSKRKTKDGTGAEARESDRGRRSAASAAPAGSAGVSFSKVDDPVEIPVEKSSKGLYIGGALALVAVLAIGGLVAMGGDDAPKQPPAPANTQASEPAPAKQPDPTPAATEEKKAEPAPTAQATAAPTAEPSAAPTAEPAATQEPVAKKDPPPAKPTADKPSSAGTPPSSGGTKPSGGGGKKGGIMRDAPF